MATLTLSGPRADVIEMLEDLVSKIRDEDEDDPSVAFMPNDASAGAFYIEYDSSDDNEDLGVLYELER